MPILDWLNKDAAVNTAKQVPYRLLQAVPELSAGDPNNQNMLIEGDNLDALKALLPLYAGQVKCIYIDPPYNTKSAFEHYDDNLEHSQWLSIIYPRLELLRELLAEDGSIWVSIDDNEAHYLKVIMDEVFGRKNFITSMVWQKRYSRENRTAIGEAHEHILLYAKNPDTFKQLRNKLPLGEKQLKPYKNDNNDPRGPWRGVSLSAQGYRPNQMYEITAPNGKKHIPPAGSCWKIIESKYNELLKNDRIYFGKDGNAIPSRKQFLNEVEGMVPWTWWPHDEAGHTDEAKREGHRLFSAELSFGTPKPERLIERILHIATNPNDLVLDSFLGSGTTAAVAHKMKRRYIGIEMGEHAQTHCQPRLAKVIGGEQGGISKAVNWQGGGGFHYYRLGPSVFDEFGAIRPEVRFADLATHLWFLETKQPLQKQTDTPLLGVHNGTAYYLLYNGILGDRRPQGGNVLTNTILDSLPTHSGPKVIYGESSRLGPARLAQEQISFKQIPYDVRTR
ncbi:site-specific DNA-methyltransferase [Neptuniibacter sp. CAU 1671]|uniref:site-specific DNA-methyltransferase n=1 Tax=Neptuniibacter sp. CAU 1671 TaxID=3032593 RepID=UPI0023D994D7|nr:site-specific DNA-methyltransferase [Neptuniibacter sp. CAU 1671]MDF2182571.1 site-specific DNA-methyltransferase [Neptuniibacter sp. CAU 1671]